LLNLNPTSTEPFVTAVSTAPSTPEVRRKSKKSKVFERVPLQIEKAFNTVSTSHEEKLKRRRNARALDGSRKRRTRKTLIPVHEESSTTKSINAMFPKMRQRARSEVSSPQGTPSTKSKKHVLKAQPLKTDQDWQETQARKERKMGDISANFDKVETLTIFTNFKMDFNCCGISFEESSLKITVT
jgi:hypothetical protein